FGASRARRGDLPGRHKWTVGRRWPSVVGLRTVWTLVPLRHLPSAMVSAPCPARDGDARGRLDPWRFTRHSGPTAYFGIRTKRGTHEPAECRRGRTPACRLGSPASGRPAGYVRP